MAAIDHAFIVRKHLEYKAGAQHREEQEAARKREEEATQRAKCARLLPIYKDTVLWVISCCAATDQTSDVHFTSALECTVEEALGVVAQLRYLGFTVLCPGSIPDHKDYICYSVFGTVTGGVERIKYRKNTPFNFTVKNTWATQNVTVKTEQV